MSRCLKDIIFISPALLKMFVCNFCSFFLLFLNSSSWLVFEVTCLIDIGQVHYFLSDFVLKSTVMSLWLKILHIQCAYMEDIRMKDKQSFRLKKKKMQYYCYNVSCCSDRYHPSLNDVLNAAIHDLTTEDHSIILTDLQKKEKIRTDHI